MFPINDYAVFQRRHEELLKKAENERLIQQAKSNRPETLKSWHMLSFQPGLQFMNWGRKLWHMNISHNRQHSTSFSPRSSSR